MAFYTQTEKMVNEVIDDILAYRDLVGETDETKSEKYGFTPGLNMTNETVALTEQANILREGIFQVLFTGGFSSGKSTLLNALMRKDVLKTGINPETAVITKIIFNAEEKIIVYKKAIDASGKQITEEMTIESFFKKYRVDQEDPEMFADIDYVQLQQSQDGIGGSMVQMVDSPGTQNSKADDEAARGFAKKASAIVYLINATKPFEFDEKEYIRDHFEGKNLRNLFFIINRFDCVAENQIESLKDNVKLQLKKVFTNDRGIFDEELFSKRVFYTNAYGSFCARLGKPVKVQGMSIEIDDNVTGVPKFEDALGKFLTDDNRDRDALAAYVPKMATIYVNAESKIAAQMKLYGEGIAKLTEDKAAMDEAIVKARKTIENIEDDCKSTAQNVLVEIKTAYDNYVADVEQGWDAHFEAHPVHLSIPDLVKAMLSKNESVKQEKMKPIQEAIKQYVDSKSAGLNQSIGDILQTNVTSLEQRLALYQEQLEALQCPVDINEILAKIYAVSSKTGGANPNIKVNTFQLILGLAGGDLDIAMGAFTDSQSNKEAVIKSITKNVFEYIALNVVAWPIGLAMLVVRGYNIIKSLKDGGNMGAKNVLNRMKPGTIDGLRSGKKNLMMDLEKQLGGAFIRAGTTFSESLNNELTTYQKSFEEMVENLGNENFNIEKENERTQKLLGEMARIINNVCRLTMNKELSIYEIKAFAEKAPTAE